jgi:phosphonate transport system ATP-binding protein
VIRARDLVLGYGDREVLKSVDIDVPAGQFLVLLGPSGSGKTTLLMALNGSIPVRSGGLEVLGKSPAGLHGAEMERFREKIGFIFQSFHLVGRLPVLHNVGSGLLSRIPMFRAVLQWYVTSEFVRILEALRVVGLEDRVLDRCDRLSGGQKQRVAIARALVQQPALILADEPISALDPRSATGVLEVLRRASRQFGITVVCSLHHLEAARSYADRVIGLNEGRFVYDGPPEGLSPEIVETIYQGEDPQESDPSDSLVPSHNSGTPSAA